MACAPVGADAKPPKGMACASVGADAYIGPETPPARSAAVHRTAGAERACIRPETTPVRSAEGPRPSGAVRACIRPFRPTIGSLPWDDGRRGRHHLPYGGVDVRADVGIVPYAAIYSFFLLCHAHKKRRPSGRLFRGMDYCAFLASLAAFLAVSTRVWKALGSAMAISDRALRFISMPACFRPYMNQL